MKKNNRPPKPADLIKDLEDSQRDLGRVKTLVERAKQAAEECLALPEGQLQLVQAEFVRQIVEYESLLLAGWRDADALRAKSAELGLDVEPRKAWLAHSTN